MQSKGLFVQRTEKVIVVIHGLSSLTSLQLRRIVALVSLLQTMMLPLGMVTLCMRMRHPLHNRCFPS